MLGSNGLRLGQHAFNTWFATVPHDTKPESLLEPSYWRHHTRTLRPTDVIRAFCEDGTWEMWLTVVKPDVNAVYVSTLFIALHEDTASVETDDMRLVWKGPVRQFCIVRASSGEPIVENLYPKSRAEAEMARLRNRAA